jgi:transcription initiation factor TFIID subunit 10
MSAAASTQPKQTSSNMASNPPESTDPTQSQNVEQEETADVAGIPESKLPTRKDTSLREFLSKMDDYAPLVRWRASLWSPSLPLADRCRSRTPSPTTT